MKNTTLQSKMIIPLGDSKEVLQEYYLGRILQLEKSLDRLNLLEHPIEIRTVCSKIISAKRLLKQRAGAKK